MKKMVTCVGQKELYSQFLKLLEEIPPFFVSWPQELCQTVGHTAKFIRSFIRISFSHVMGTICETAGQKNRFTLWELVKMMSLLTYSIHV